MSADMALDENHDKKHNVALVKGNLRALNQLIAGLGAIGEETYRARPDEKNSPIGGHVRHIIEFYQEFLNNAHGQTVSYDRRVRNLEIEQSQSLAVKELAAIVARIETLEITDNTLSLSMFVDPAEPMITMKTNIQRELFHVLDHCIHHMAMVKLVAAQMGAEFDQNFGVANSTQNHLKSAG